MGHLAKGVSQRRIARAYNVGKSTIGNIATGGWAHVS